MPIAVPGISMSRSMDFDMSFDARESVMTSRTVAQTRLEQFSFIYIDIHAFNIVLQITCTRDLSHLHRQLDWRAPKAERFDRHAHAPLARKLSHQNTYIAALTSGWLAAYVGIAFPVAFLLQILVCRAAAMRSCAR